MPTTQTVQRTVARGANPFAALVKQQNIKLTPSNTHKVYESVKTRGDRVANHPAVISAIATLKKKLKKQKYTQAHFGELVLAPFGLIDINIDIQRDEDALHIAEDIIARFDPRIAMPVMCTKLKSGRYSAWEGQQTSLALYVLHKAGLIDDNTLVQLKSVDETLTVPGSKLKGEAVSNMGFRIINGGGRKSIDAYHLHRSRVTGVRLYLSTYLEDLQSEEIQQILEKNNMFPDKSGAKSKASPGMVTYIHGLNLIANHNSDQKIFDVCKNDLDWALAWHNKYYSHENGVDGGIILALGRLSAAARTSSPAIVLDDATGEDLYKLFRAKYGSPKDFHNDCKNRLEGFQKSNNLKTSWSDSCLTPILVMDYINWGGKCALPQVSGMTTYAGI